MARQVVKIARVGHYEISYTMSDGTIGVFQGEPEFCQFVLKAWEKRQACGFMLAQTPKGEQSRIYVVPTTDGVSLMVRPKRPLKILHTERDNSQESMVQITLEDEE